MLLAMCPDNVFLLVKSCVLTSSLRHFPVLPFFVSINTKPLWMDFHSRVSSTLLCPICSFVITKMN